MCVLASMAERKRVPQKALSAPSAKAALNFLLSVFPLAAITGILTELAISGKIENVPILLPGRVPLHPFLCNNNIYPGLFFFSRQIRSIIKISINNCYTMGF